MNHELYRGQTHEKLRGEKHKALIIRSGGEVGISKVALHGFMLGVRLGIGLCIVAVPQELSDSTVVHAHNFPAVLVIRWPFRTPANPSVLGFRSVYNSSPNAKV